MFGTGRQQRIDDLTRRVGVLEQAVAELRRHAGLPAAGAFEVQCSDAVRALVAEGRTVAAIKRLRTETGLGLREAKEIVDRL